MQQNPTNKNFLKELKPWIINLNADLIGDYAPRNIYIDEVNWISRLLDVDIDRIGVLINTVDGDAWIMIDNFWRGDLLMWQEYMHNRYEMDSVFIESLKNSIENHYNELKSSDCF